VVVCTLTYSKELSLQLRVFQKGGALNCRAIANILNIYSKEGIPSIAASSIFQSLREMSPKRQQSCYSFNKALHKASECFSKE